MRSGSTPVEVNAASVDIGRRRGAATHGELYERAQSVDVVVDDGRSVAEAYAGANYDLIYLVTSRDFGG